MNTCKECGTNYDNRHLCPNRNKVIIYCGICDNKILDFIMYPGYTYPILPVGMCGAFVCNDCQFKAIKYLYETL